MAYERVIEVFCDQAVCDHSVELPTSAHKDAGSKPNRHAKRNHHRNGEDHRVAVHDEVAV
jgi:hypothetical protein